MSRPIARRRWLWSALAVACLGLGYAVTMPRSAVHAADPPKAGDAKGGTDAKSDVKSDATFEVYKDHAGEYRWRLRTANKQVIATSGEGYKEKRDCLAGVESVKRHAAGAKVEEQPAQ